MARFKLIFIGAALIFLLAARLAVREQPQSVLKEKIAVVNVEVPVRVFLDGLPLAGLQKEDFQIFEDKQPQTINGFYQRRKKMHIQHVDIQTGQEPGELAPRYFVLCFRLLDFNDQLRQGIDYFFRHLLRAQDEMLVLVNERTLLLNQDIWKVKRQEILEQVLQDEAVKARQEKEAYFMRVQQDIDQARLRIMLDNDPQSISPQQVLGFLQGYLNVWQEFKKKYLVPDLDKFYGFARHLQNVKAEKWVLNFYQIETFPKMKISGSIRQQIDDLVMQWTGFSGAAEHFAREVNRLLDAIDRTLMVGDEFPAEEIGKMLIQVDTTYHCLISGVAREGLSEDLEYKKVASDLENSLREITKSSGGEVIFSGDIGAALHTIEEKEDVYYVLTYEPKNRESRGKVRIRLSNPRCRLVYDERVRSEYIAEYLKKKGSQDPTLELDRIFLAGRRLQLEISQFKMVEAKAKKSGQLRVAVSVRDDLNRMLYDQSRSLTAKEAKVALTVDFAFLKPGKYFFLVDVQDLLTGRTVTDVLLAEVSASAY